MLKLNIVVNYNCVRFFVIIIIIIVKR